MKKILPIHEPIIQHNPANAYLLSVIGESEDEYAWIMNNFANMRYNPHTHYDDFFRNDMWYNCYLITENRFTREFIDQFYDDAFDMVKRLIDSGFYTYLFLNVRYIPIFNFDKDYWHNPMIYGYDEEEGLIYLSDFFDGRRLMTGTCMIEEFRRAYPYPKNDEEFYYFVWNRAFKKKEGYQYKFDIAALYQKLRDYKEGINFNQSQYKIFDSNDVEEVEFLNVKGGYDYIYGNLVYDAICKDLIDDKLQVRALHLICEFESIMYRRIIFLEDKGYLKPDKTLFDECKCLCREAEIIRNLFLKYKFSDSLNEKHKFKICSKLMELKSKEKCMIEMLLNRLRKDNDINVNIFKGQ